MNAMVRGALRFVRALRSPSKATNQRRLLDRGESIAPLIIREAEVDDIPKLAALHVKTWNATYFPTMGPPVEVREWQWVKRFATDDGTWFCFVIERPDSELVGFAQGNVSDNPDFEGELNKIYLLSEYQRLGLGRRLVAHVVRRFLAQGVVSMWVYSDETNPSGHFYKVLGGKNLLNADGTVNHGNYGWRDLNALATICPIE